MMGVNHPKLTLQSVLAQLCVIALVIVSAFAILPSFDRVKPKALQTSCASNLRQIGLGMLQYSEDNDGVLPARQMRAADGSVQSWRVAINPYIRSTSLYQCPANPFAKHRGEFRPVGAKDSDFSRSYAVNSTSDGAQCFGPFSDHFPRGYSLTKAETPRTLLEIVETTAAYSDFNVLAPENFRWPSSEKSQSGHLFFGHLNHTNALYCDGHVRTQPAINLLGASEFALNPWTVDGKAFPPADQAKATSVVEYGATHSQSK